MSVKFAEREQPQRSEAGRSPARTSWLFLLLCLALAAALRAPYFAGPHSADEAAYVTVAREILEGRPPLERVWFNRSPPLYLWYALAAALPLGVDWGLQLVTLAAWVCGAWLLYRILASLVPGRWPQLGALLYAALSADRSIQAETANTEPLLNLLLLASFWQLVRWRETRRDARLLVAGFLAAGAVLIKEQVIFFLPLVPLAFFGSEPRRALRAWSRFGAGAGAAVVGSVLIAAALGILDEWWQVIRFHAGYSSLPWKNLAAGPLLLGAERPWSLFGTWPLWFLALALLGDRRSWTRQALAARLYLLATAAMVVATGHHFAHYLMLAVPPLVLSTVPGLAALATEAPTRRIGQSLAVALVLFVATVQGLALFDRVPLEVRKLSPLGEQSEAVRECARRLASSSGRDETLFVFGWEPTFYLYSGLSPAAPDVWGYSLGAAGSTGSVVDWLATRTAAALEARPPDWLVVRGSVERGAVWEALALDLSNGAMVASSLCDDLPPLERQGIRLFRRGDPSRGSS